jgi:hypothetical protein
MARIKRCRYHGVGAVLRIIVVLTVANCGGGLLLFASGQSDADTNMTIIDGVNGTTINTNTTIDVDTTVVTAAGNITLDLLHFGDFVEYKDVPDLQDIDGVLIKVLCPEGSNINLRCLCPVGIRWTIEPTPNEDDPVTLSMQPANILQASVETGKATLDLTDPASTTYSTLVFTYSSAALTSPPPPLTGVRLQVPARKLKYIGVAEGNQLQIRQGIRSLGRIIVTEQSGLVANITTSDETSQVVLDLSIDRGSVVNISLVEPLDDIIAASADEDPLANETDSTIDANVTTVTNTTTIDANVTTGTVTNTTTITTIIVVANSTSAIASANIRDTNDNTTGVAPLSNGEVTPMAQASIRPGPVKVDLKDSSILFLKGTIHSGRAESRSTIHVQGTILSLFLTGGAAVVVNPFLPPNVVVQEGNSCDNVEIARFAGTCDIDESFTMTFSKRAALFNNTAVQCGGSSAPVEVEDKMFPPSTAYSVDVSAWIKSSVLAALATFASAMALF